MRLVIGNKNYSSWSMRPWIAMKALGIAFDEDLISLDATDFKARVGALSGTGKVPVLVDGEIIVWESLSILEYLAERFPRKGVWPADVAARALARTVSSEMLAGFIKLRRHCPMNMWRPPRATSLPDDVMVDVRRIDTLWSDCRARFGQSGDFLFGGFCAADAMYAPVVARFQTYGVHVSETSQTYMSAMTALPAWTEWRDAALQEEWVLPHDEPDWPDVPRLKA